MEAEVASTALNLIYMAVAGFVIAFAQVCCCFFLIYILFLTYYIETPYISVVSCASFA